MKKLASRWRLLAPALTAMGWQVKGVMKTCAFVAPWLVAVSASLSYAQGTIRTSIPPVEYTPFEVTVTMSKEGCYDSMFPLLGETQYVGGTLSVVLSQLRSPVAAQTTLVCGRERKFVVPGLPRGRQEIKVSVTEPVGPFIAETIAATLDVAPISPNITVVNFWTGSYFPSSIGSGSVGPPGFYLSPRRFAVWPSQWNWLELGDEETNYTFKGFNVSDSETLPSWLVRLSNVAYPEPFRGRFWTTDAALAQRLASEWNSGPTLQGWAVGRLVSGSCPIGMSPVYQTFHPKAVAHRWTQSRTAYAALLANGYMGDGPVWCAPALRSE
jgi:hypothetical protein